ncbi:ribosome maturation factor RimP [Serinicoccus kebangsaanensis]|uniref:ribosome maturation factor RimP n=1 Tax=Serinicoccus kebangsaanensis TaxID=2602069 RepID=UPI00124CBC74|nr:ribosome maturation factor RimP [Serinicoccus kebangsaanensis]
MDARAAAATITQHTSAALLDTDLDVVVDAVTVQEAGRRRLVRVLLARDVSGLAPDDTTSPVAPLSLDEVSAATRAVSEALDGSDVMGERSYTLEVSSAGLDRPLTTPDQFRRNVGRLVRLTREDGSAVTARLLEAGPDHLRLEDQPEPIAVDDVAKAQVQVEFTRPDGKDA